MTCSNFPDEIDLSKVPVYQGFKKDAPVECFFDGCSNSIQAYGMCGVHYNHYRYKKPEQIKRLKEYIAVNKPTHCTIENCKAPIRSVGLCQTHYHQERLKKYPEAKEKIRKSQNKSRNKAPNPNEYFHVEDTLNDVLKSVEQNKLIIRTNVNHLAKLMGLDNSTTTHIAIQNLADGDEIQYRLNIHNQNITFIFDEFIELRDLIAQISKTPGILEVPGRWRDPDGIEPARIKRRKSK